MLSASETQALKMEGELGDLKCSLLNREKPPGKC